MLDTTTATVRVEGSELCAPFPAFDVDGDRERIGTLTPGPATGSLKDFEVFRMVVRTTETAARIGSMLDRDLRTGGGIERQTGGAIYSRAPNVEAAA